MIFRTRDCAMYVRTHGAEWYGPVNVLFAHVRVRTIQHLHPPIPHTTHPPPPPRRLVHGIRKNVSANIDVLMTQYV